MEEKIIALINSNKATEAEAALQAEILHSVEMGYLKTENLSIHFAEQTILEGRLKVTLPEDFTIMPDETARLKYPLETRPRLIYTSQDGMVNITFNHSRAALQDGGVARFKDGMMRVIEQMQAEARWEESGVKEVAGRKVGFCDFVVPALDEDIYTFMFFMELSGRALIGGVNCPATRMNTWKFIALGLANSLKVNTGLVQSPVPVGDYTHYEFKTGFYTCYQGKEYRLFKLEDGSCRLVSRDPSDLANGFEKKDGGYRKTVAKNELQTVYEFKTRIIYQGHQFELGQALKDRIQLIIRDCNLDLASQLDLEHIGNHEYEKWVTKDLIEDVAVEKVILTL